MKYVKKQRTDDHSSYAASLPAVYPIPADQPATEEPKLAPAKVEHDVVPSQSRSAATSVHSGDLDEGRHRNHPLYAKGPEPDGMYHCPFKAKESCPHRPTKLKCNYEYDIKSLLHHYLCICTDQSVPIQQIHRLAPQAISM